MLSELAWAYLWSPVAGAALVSFGMSAGDRWNRESRMSEYIRRIALGWSRCDHCGCAIAPVQLTRIVGWLLGRGRCGCRLRRLVVRRYLVGEICGAVCGGTTVHLYGLHGLWLLLSMGGLAAAWASDVRTREVHELHCSVCGLGTVGFVLSTDPSLDRLIIPALLTGLFVVFSAVAVMRRAAPTVPGGDVMLLAVTTPAVSLSQVPLFLFALAAASAAMAPRNRAGAFPLAPAIAAAFAVTLFLPLA